MVISQREIQEEVLYINKRRKYVFNTLLALGIVTTSLLTIANGFALSKEFSKSGGDRTKAIAFFICSIVIWILLLSLIVFKEKQIISESKIKQDRKALENDLDATKSELEKIKEEAEETRSQLSGLEKKIEEKESEFSKLKKDIEEENGNLGKLNERIQVEENELSKLSEKIKEKEGKLGELEKKIEILEGKKDALDKIFKCKEESIEGLNINIEKVVSIQESEESIKLEGENSVKLEDSLLFELFQMDKRSYVRVLQRKMMSRECHGKRIELLMNIDGCWKMLWI